MKRKYIMPWLTLSAISPEDIIGTSEMSCVDGDADYEAAGARKYDISDDFWSEE